ncbi:MAG: cupredoxin domain-containing protein [candidate division SR1 bacterium]|nr:cupredoxin domain-containing protein [candidate division SR1 bacterium]
MSKKNFMPIAVLGIALVAVTLTGCGREHQEENAGANTGAAEEMTTGTADAVPMNTDEVVSTGKEDTKVQAKEFTMTSFVEMSGDKYFPQYSMKEITVKKGDVVRVKVTVTKGMHDFNIDEFNVHSKTPLDQETVIEFTADKAGKFIYYCSMPGHRANGHWGTLTVTE